METILTIKSEEKKKRIDEGQEKGNRRNITTPRPRISPAPQSQPKKDKKD